MPIADTLTSVLGDHRLNAVLVDIGASGGAPEIWKPLAPHATYVGFDPDLREIRTDTAGGYRSGIIINKAVCADRALESVPFFLTESPYCSSMLQPNGRALSKYSFASLFRVTRTTTVPATTLDKVVEEYALGQIDWLKIDAQGADLRIYDSLTDDLRNRLLAIDTEPGLIDAYQDEDLFVDVHRRLRGDGFWLSHIEVRGVPRISESVLAELGISTRSGIPALKQGHLRSSPGWCEARYLRTVESMKDKGLGEREFVLGWAFALVDGQYGHAFELARAVKEDLRNPTLGNKLWAAAEEAMNGSRPPLQAATPASGAVPGTPGMRRMISMLAAALIGILWLALSATANFDQAEGRHVLHMDEMLVHDETAKILQAGSTRELVHAVKGEDQRYGRPLWYVAAAAAAIPASLLGERGQIVATRMALALCLLAACAVFAFTWIRSALLRPLSLVVLLTVPATSYFATTPKPEPLQMLLLAVFLWLFLLRGNQVKSWLLFGAAFGTKINALVLVPILAAFSWARRKARGRAAARASALPFAWFLLGFVASVPVLLTGMEGIRYYLGWTFLNTAHGSDDPDIGPIDWAAYMAGELFSGPLVLRWALLLIVLFMPLVLVAGKRRASVREPVVALYACGVVLVLSIAFGVQRIWGHYLYPGLLLLYVAAFASIDRFLRDGPAARKTAVAALLVVLAASWANAVREIQELSRPSKRPSQAEYARKLSEYGEIMKMLRDLAAHKDGFLRVAISPHMFRPASTSAWTVTPFWGPFLGWQEGYDVVIMYKEETAESDTSSSNPATQEALKLSRKLYAERTAGNCAHAPCYTVQPLFDGDLKILVKR